VGIQALAALRFRSSDDFSQQPWNEKMFMPWEPGATSTSTTVPTGTRTPATGVTAATVPYGGDPIVLANLGSAHSPRADNTMDALISREAYDVRDAHHLWLRFARAAAGDECSYGNNEQDKPHGNWYRHPFRRTQATGDPNRGQFIVTRPQNDAFWCAQRESGRVSPSKS